MEDPLRNTEFSIFWSDRVVECPQCGKKWRLTYAASLRDDWADALPCCPVRPWRETLPDKPHFLSGAESNSPIAPAQNPVQADSFVPPPETHAPQSE